MIVTVTLVLLTILLIAFALRQKSNQLPPGPFCWPIIGNLIYVKRLEKKLGAKYLALMELSKMYNSGVIGLQLGSMYTIAVSDSKLVQQVCLNEKYDGRPWNEFIKLRNLGMKKGLTMNDGPEWKQLHNWTTRALRNVGFAKPAMIDLLVDELAIIIEKLGDGGVRPLRPVFAPALINALWMLVSGTRASANSSKLQRFIQLIDHRSTYFDSAGGVLSAFPWLRYIAPEMSNYNIHFKMNVELKSFLMDNITEHKKRYIEGNEADFIDLFIKEMHNSKGQPDKANVYEDGNLIVTLVDFFIAGTGTTTATLDILFFQIANHQDVQRRLHEEIDAVIGPHRVPTLEDRKKMPYTEAIMTESQRIRNVVPILPAHRTVEDTILDGYKIPKDTMVLLNAESNNMDPELYPDPISFRPERYINKDGIYQTPENLILFGKGKRRCLGEIMARSAIFLIFVGIMQKYCLLPEPGKGYVNGEFVTGLMRELKPYKMLIVRR
ncbi:probable cytochrome P450 305a1 [Monomorium pharaonis]|uniref:probable cytochrome P450 305a1 n=1 Tax=Monomorium pharaonis TaxID=307658 RepID=UPI001747396B|nr:probable cytochrome P450 305a1 [Monomorium pharaonis]